MRLLTLDEARSLADSAGMSLQDALREIRDLTGIMPSIKGMETQQARHGHLGRAMSACLRMFFGIIHGNDAAVPA